MSDLAAIIGTRSGMKELADGTVRVQIDIDPPHRENYFKWFSEPHIKVVVGRLGEVQEQQEPERPTGYPGGEDQRVYDEIEQRTEQLMEAKGKPAPKKTGKFPPGRCGLAVRWCADAHFQVWLMTTMPTSWEISEHMEDPEEIAKAIILDRCGIGSRKELDTNDVAAGVFDELFRGPYANARKDDELPE
jgi:hypothetical protein